MREPHTQDREWIRRQARVRRELEAVQRRWARSLAVSSARESPPDLGRSSGL